MSVTEPNWLEATEAIVAGHRFAPAQVADTLINRGAADPSERGALLTRSAWIPGLGILVKAATVMDGNPGRGLASVHGAVSLFSDVDGRPDGSVEFEPLTRWKTAADSLLAARRLARPGSARILLIGAGAVASSMRDAYHSVFPDATFAVAARSAASRSAFTAEWPDVETVDAGDSDALAAAVGEADVIATCTTATTPVLRGAWLRPGQHIDLIGAYRADMREADDEVMRRARVFVDARATTIDHIGELIAPIAAGAISAADVIADFTGLDDGTFARTSPEEITVCKNGGGAHLDLMVARYLSSCV